MKLDRILETIENRLEELTNELRWKTLENEGLKENLNKANEEIAYLKGLLKNGKKD
jgi:archaellum component FlaC